MMKGFRFDPVSNRDELIRSISSIVDGGGSENCTSEQRSKIEVMLKEYLETPRLLDTVLPSFLGILFRGVDLPVLYSQGIGRKERCLLEILSTACGVRGYKGSRRYFPNDVSLMPKLFESVASFKGYQYGPEWPVLHSLLMWSALLILQPFELSLLQEALLKDFLSSLFSFMTVNGPVGASAALCLSQLYHRPDFDPADLIDRFLGLGSESERVLVFNYVLAIQGLLKILDREKSFEHAYKVIEFIDGNQNLFFSDSELHKKSLKVLRTCALILLPTAAAPITVFVPEEVELVLSLLLDSLRSNFGAIRYEAARSIAEISRRLPAEPRQEVYLSVLELLSVDEPENTWQGACIAIGEFARLGMLPLEAEILDETFSIIREALEYEVPQGNNSLGKNVRDTAAYVCWAVGRALGKNGKVRGYLKDIGPTLLGLTLLDPELNCRRAGAAAFQEISGRIPGLYPNDLDIIVLASFEGVSNLSRTYLSIVPRVAGMADKYRTYFVAQLWKRRVFAPEQKIRVLAAESLEILVSGRQDLLGKIIDDLERSMFRRSFRFRQGAWNAISRLLPHVETEYRRFEELFLSLFSENSWVFKGKSGQQFRETVALFVDALIGNLSYRPSEAFARSVGEFLRETLAVTTRSSALDGVLSCVGSYSRVSGSKETLRALIGEVRRRSGAATRVSNFVLAIGNWQGTDVNYDVVGRVLVDAYKKAKAVEVRRDTLRSLRALYERRVFKKATEDAYSRVIIAGSADRTKDARGDVGSWVRLESLVCMNSFGFRQDFMEPLVRMSLERMDSVREVATLLLYRFSDGFVPGFSRELEERMGPYRFELSELLDKGGVIGEFRRNDKEAWESEQVREKYLDSIYFWRKSHVTMPIVSKHAFRSDRFASVAFRSLLGTVASLTYSLKKVALDCLYEFAVSDPEAFWGFCTECLQSNPREVFATVDYALNDRSGAEDVLLEGGKHIAFLEVVSKRRFKADIQMVKAVVGFLEREKVPVLAILLPQLCAGDPAFRRAICEEIYLKMLVMDIEDEGEQEIVDILSEDFWGDNSRRDEILDAISAISKYYGLPGCSPAGW